MPTHPSKTIPEPWLSFLRELDSAVQEEVRLDCMGGFIVTMVYGFSRPTGDLDVLEIIPQAAGLTMLELGMRGAPLHKKYKIYLDRVGVAKVPDEYESRLTEIFRKTRRVASDGVTDGFDSHSLPPFVLPGGVNERFTPPFFLATLA